MLPGGITGQDGESIVGDQIVEFPVDDETVVVPVPVVVVGSVVEVAVE